MSRFSPVLMVVIFSMVALIRRMHSLRLSTPHMRRVGATSTSFSSSSAPNKHKAQAWRVSTSRFLSSNAPISSTVLPGHLYIVATPIGNLEDITIRALKVLQQADVVCAEDTRHTTSLLRHHNLPFKKLVSHHEHSNNIKDILELLKSGQSVALVSDAGTPGVNDPGSSVVTACHQSCIPVHPIPGPSAVAAAVSVSGMGSVHSFVGFLPVKGTEREQRLKYISSLRHAVVFFESPHRILGTMQDLQQHLSPNRGVTICRELTKMYEEVIQCSNIDQSIKFIEVRDGRSDNEGGGIKGEFTVVIGPTVGDVVNSDAPNDDDGIRQAGDDDGYGNNVHKECIKRICDMKNDGISRSEAVKLITTMYIDEAKLELGKTSKGGKSKEKMKVKMTKSEIYKLALEMDGWVGGDRASM